MNRGDNGSTTWFFFFFSVAKLFSANWLQHTNSTSLPVSSGLHEIVSACVNLGFEGLNMAVKQRVGF